MHSDDEFRIVRELLASWKLTELIEHLHAEGINIAELEVMKRQHVAELLRGYKLGIRIRFEHYFELWRKQMNKPLAPCHTQCMHCCQQCSSTLMTTPTPTAAEYTHTLPLPTTRHKESRGTNTVSKQCTDAQTNTRPSRSPTLTPTSPPAFSSLLVPEVVHELPKLTPQPKRLTTELTSTTAATTAHIPVIAAQQYNASPLPLPHMDAPLRLYAQDCRNGASITVLEILRASNVKGASLLQYYQEHHELTNSHRSLLISLIVNFFDDHDFHLSLNMSHNLEMQILRLFPTEKLEQYRTEKRGKIYVKFCNMKRYRRDRPSLKRKCDTLMPSMRHAVKEGDYVEPNNDDDEFLLGFDSWADNVQVKTEHFGDDDFQ